MINLLNVQETCKAVDDQDAERISNLKQMKKDYEEKIKSIEDAMKSGTEEPVTAEEINKLRNGLFEMKNFGPNLRPVEIITIILTKKFYNFSIFRNIFDQIEQSKQEAARGSHVLIRPTATSWKQRASKAFNNFWQHNFIMKYITGHQEEGEEEEDNDDVSDFDEEFEDATNDGNLEVDRRGNKKERKKIFFEK